MIAQGDKIHSKKKQETAVLYMQQNSRKGKQIEQVLPGHSKRIAKQTKLIRASNRLSSA